MGSMAKISIPLRSQNLITRPEKFDMMILGVMGLLLIGIAALILIGNTTGVQVVSHSPTSLTAADAIIRLEFDTPMSAESVEQHLDITPATEGRFEWPNPKELVFRPATPLIPGEKYTVKLAAGTTSEENQQMDEDFQFDFRVRLPKILYIGPYTSLSRQLQLLSLQTGNTEQLTDVARDVLDFAVSPDGQWVAYTVEQTDTASDIWALNLETHEHIQLTNCVEAQATCLDPAWGPDNQVVAYTRQELDTEFTSVNAKRAWVVDLNTLESRLLIEDETLVGFAPKWSPDGKWVAIVLATATPPGILLYEFETGQSAIVPTQQGIPGIFSTDSNYFVYSKLAYGAADTTYYSHLAMVNLADLAQGETALSGDSATPIDDLQAAFHPDGTHLALVRRYLDERYTQGGQLYLLDLATLEATPLVVDDRYSHGGISWSSDGHLLLFQRYNLESQRDPTEIWVYTVPTGELRQAAVDGVLPRFLP
jgi:Tol biopolymer transport system component